MGRRQSVYAIVRVPADGGESPNAVVPQASAEVRLFYPPNDRDAAERALTAAVAEAWERFYG
jgi:hypothetical protein